MADARTCNRDRSRSCEDDLQPGAHPLRHARVAVDGDRILINGRPVKLIGLRCSNALVSAAGTQMLVDNLPVFRGYGVNAVSVFLMGSRFGDVKGYRPDAALDAGCTARLSHILREADRLGMVVLVGCLYWGNSRAKEDLEAVWTQEDASRAVANTAAWLQENGFGNVIIDPDNEGMAARAMDWSIEAMIDAAHAAAPGMPVGYNNHPPPPDNADVLLHFSPSDRVRPWVQSEGTPENAPGGYWGAFSKEPGYGNYLRIGRYTPEMKADQIRQTRRDVNTWAGHFLASTWLQCAPHEGVGGPFMVPGGRAETDAVDHAPKVLQPDAGIRWWLEWVRDRYAPWRPPA